MPAMSHGPGEHAQLPVVIGSGLTGLSISHSLSSAGIDHLLIGRRPEMSPRLGESLNPDGQSWTLEGEFLARRMR